MEEHYEAAVRASRHAAVVVGHDGRVLFANPAAGALLGRPAAKLIGRPLPVTGGKGAGELELSLPDGETRLVEVDSEVVRSTDGETQLLLLYDVTEQRRRQSLQKEVVSHFSHELRTPLASLHQCLTILLDGITGPIGTEQREFLAIALKNVHQIRELLDVLREAVSAYTGSLVLDPLAVRIGEVLSEALPVLREMAAEKRQRLRIEVEKTLPPVFADPKRLHETLVYLVGYALRQTPAEEEIVVEARLRTGPPEVVELSISDAGPGLSEEESAYLFESFFLAGMDSAKRGAGYEPSLYVAKELSLRQGGSLEVESAPGESTRFLLTLPPFSVAAQLEPVLARLPAAGGGTDELISIDLHRSGYEPLTAENRSFLRAAQERLRELAGEAEVLLPRLGHTDRGEVFFVLSEGRGGDASHPFLERLRQDAGLGHVLSASAMEMTTARSSLGGSARGGGTQSWRENVCRWIQETLDAYPAPHGRREVKLPDP